MTPAARHAAAIGILDSWLAGSPIEPAYQGWARGARYAGSKDRAAVRDIVFDALRCRRSFAARGGAETGRGLVIGLVRSTGGQLTEIFSGTGHAPEPLTEAERAAGREPSRNEAADMPDWLLPRLEEAFGERTEAVCDVLRRRAPMHLRVNLRRTDRDTLVESLLREGIEAEPHPEVATAVSVTSNPRRVARSSALSEGLAEVQDASSQAVVHRLVPYAGRSVLDYCAGAGGKSLAFADLTDAAILAHDIAAARMADLPERAARAGIGVPTATPGTLDTARQYDLVFCDAPCSGSGTWRRDPEAKWRLTPARLAELSAMQDDVLDAAAGLVARDGHLAYATCSILKEENEDRIAAFLARTPGWVERERLRIEPSETGDGFFLAILARA
ncbi:RsmB/NOP family class I SAM-dependent RNA methyltransferase [Histidinibacterium aquaticum]|uniref:RsmB/NOP family class I SAM-dependent RNA methyltransferase n=1 Tax=Histidinibacterium aquaticum TaxID=2613962 RepID=A0A5J5GLL0_9RHOB|nr:RsmB/NOP family class I SAM-dependent RNA methyltransferase [Histidinibacterium aquaticum]KAA9009236.1 RsmB/NOP family class I SAM-dependent RNA methyltransferase [Histidinibacterium aquaticum]